MKTRSFFETHAHEYDILTNAKQRELFHKKEIAALINKFQPKTVLDAGCATGLTSFLISRNNIKTVGLDRSKSMLKMAKEKYGHLTENLTFRYGNFEKLPKALHNKFDMIVCLANSLSGVGSLKNKYYTIKPFDDNSGVDLYSYGAQVPTL